MSLADEKTDFRDDGIDTRELVRLATGGCEDAFARLAEHFRPRLIQVLRHRLGRSSADAEDVAQDALAKAFYSLSRFDARFQFSTWLYTIAFRAAQDHVRRNRRWLAFLPLSASQHHATCGGGQSNVETADQAGNIWAVAKAVLSPDQFVAMWLRYGEDLDIAEVSEIMHKSQVGVRVLLYRARLAMIQRLRDAGSSAEFGGVKQ